MNPHIKTYAEQLEAFTEQYKKETGVLSANLNDVAAWAWAKGLWKPQPQDLIKMLAGQLSRALRSIHKTDAQGRVIRGHLAVPIHKDNQRTFEWFKPEHMSYEEMLAASQYRRGLSLNDCKQNKTDFTSWNDNYSDGKLIRLDFNFNLDMEEDDTPDTHPDIDQSDDDVL